jgi:hypothetical protein
MKQTAVPFSLVISPMARTVDQEYPPPIVNFGDLGPVRCIRCKAYMCPYMQFIDSGRRFQCLFCKATTDGTVNQRFAVKTLISVTVPSRVFPTPGPHRPEIRSVRAARAGPRHLRIRRNPRVLPQQHPPQTPSDRFRHRRLLQQHQVGPGAPVVLPNQGHHPELAGRSRPREEQHAGGIHHLQQLGSLLQHQGKLINPDFQK